MESPPALFLLLTEHHMAVLLFIFLSIFQLGCGYAQYNELKSPGYPGYYPNGMDCNYYIPISYGKALKVDFAFFEIFDCW